MTYYSYFGEGNYDASMQSCIGRLSVRRTKFTVENRQYYVVFEGYFSISNNAKQSPIRRKPASFSYLSACPHRIKSHWRKQMEI